MSMKILDTLSIITLIVEIVWRVIMERLAAPRWMHYVEWGLILLIFALVILHFFIRHQEKKQQQGK